MLSWYFKPNLLVRITIGFIVGSIAGIIVGQYEVTGGGHPWIEPFVAWVGPFGNLFIDLLKMIIIPVIAATIVVGAASISPAKLGKVGIKIIAFYMVTTAFAVAIGLLLGNLFEASFAIGIKADDIDAAGQAQVAKAVGLMGGDQSSLASILLGIPLNPFEALATMQVLPTIFFCILFGIGVAFLRENKDERIKNAGDAIFNVFDGAAEVMYLIVRWILEYAPIGVMALIAVVFAKQGAKVMGTLALVCLAAYIGFIIQIIFVLGGLLLANGLSVTKFWKGAKDAMVTAFVTRSSSGTLPVSMKNADENLGVPRSTYSFTLPLGATINMNGTAIYLGVSAIFVSAAVGQPLAFSAQLSVIVTAVLVSIGTAGVPSAGAIMLLMVLTSIGMPVEAGTAVAAAYAMIFGIDSILDMGRTCLNVTGDLVGTVLVSKSEKELDHQKWS